MIGLIVLMLLSAFINTEGQSIDKHRRVTCPLPSETKKCVDDTNIIATKTTYSLVEGKCLENVQTITNQLTACTKYRSEFICPPNSCDGHLVILKRIYRNCSMAWIDFEKKPAKCCCENTNIESKEEYDEELNANRVTTTRNRWENGRCLTDVSVQTKVLNCQGQCKVEQQPCNGQVSVRTVICYLREGTQCVNSTRSVETFCGTQCNSEPYVVKGSCQGGQKTRTVTIYIKVFDPKSKTCVPELLSATEERCFCPDSSYSQVCLKELNILRSTSTKYEWRDGVCHINRAVVDRSLPCAKRPEFTSQSIGKCIHGYAEVTETYQVAAGCECVQKTLNYRKVCCCSCLNNTELQRTCMGDHYISKKQWSSFVNNEVCSLSVTEEKTPVVCEKGEKVVESECMDEPDSANQVRTVTRVRYELKDCKCVQIEISKKTEYCNCDPREDTKISCVINQQKITTRNFIKLENGSCNAVSDVKVENITCPAPTNREVNECDKTNRRYIYTTLYEKQECACNEKTMMRECVCKCEPPSVIERCLGNYTLEVKTVKVRYTECSCSNDISINHRPARPCPFYTKERVSPCNKQAKEGYEKFRIIRSKMIFKTCECKSSVSYFQQLCYCQSLERNRTECIANGQTEQVITERYTMDPSKKQCVWQQVSVFENYIRCPAASISERCATETNTLTTESVSYEVQNCACVKRVDKKKGTCSCDPNEKIVKKESCNPENCKQTIQYNIQERTVDKQCNEIQLTRQVTCCCPPADVQVKCEHGTNEFIHTNISYTLSNFTCLKDVKTIRHKVPCSNEIQIKNSCDARNRLQLRSIYVHYKRTLENCRCQWKVFKKEEGYCKCRDDLITQMCDSEKHLLTITTISQKLEPPQCIDIKKVTTKTITCPAQQIIQGECDMKKGIQFITTVTYRVDNNCECFKNLKVASVECNCERLNKITRGCHKDINELWQQTVTYKLKDGKCVSHSDIQQRPVVCQWREWKLTQRGQTCLPQSIDALDMGIREDHYERYVKTNCTCHKETKTVRCNCKCQGPEKITECNNGNLINVYYKYTWDENRCRCDKTILRKSKEVVTCPKPSRLEGQCNPVSCFKEVKTYLWQLDGCSCVRKERPSQERCCCQPSSSTMICQPFTNLHENVTQQYFLKEGVCLERKILTTTAVECQDSSYPRVTSMEKCNLKTGLQKYSLVIQVPDGCRCTEQTFYPQRPCRCPLPVIEPGECHGITKRMNITITSHRWIEGSNGGKCNKSVEILTDRPCIDCSSYEKSFNLNCMGGRVLLTSQQCVWNADKRHCHCHLVYTDRTPMCSHEVKIVEEPCDGTRNFSTVKRIRHHLCDCKCQQNVTILSRSPCKCPPKDVVKDCVNNNVLITKTTAFYLAENSCKKSLRVSEEVVRCEGSLLKDTTEADECDENTCKVKVTVTRHVVRNCLCVKETFTTHKNCCCEPRTAIIRQSCDVSRGMQIFINQTAHYDKKSGVCIHSNIVNERPVICQGKIEKKIIQKCRPVPKQNIFYQTVASTNIERKGCLCLSSKPQTREEPCGCQNSTTRVLCINNVKVTETVSFAFDGTNCLPKMNIVNVVSVQCDRPVLKRQKICAKNGIRTATLIKQKADECTCKSVKTPLRERCMCAGKTDQVCDGKAFRVRKNVPSLICPKLRPCYCIPREVTYRKVVCCEPPTETEGPCINGRRLFTLRYFIVRNCQCVLQEKVQEIPCGSEKCINEAGDEQCKRLTANNGCVRDRRIREEKCRKMCDECMDCHGEIYFTRRRGYDLNGVHKSTEHYFFMYLAYPSASLCKSACANSKDCKTFQMTNTVDNKRHACILSPLAQEELQKRLLNANAMETRLVDHFHKECKIHCPQTKYEPSDVCEDTGRTDLAQRYVRRVIVFSYSLDESGRHCIEKKEEKISPCNRTCIDLKSRDECLNIKKSEQCSTGINSILCGKTCHVTCDCSTKTVYSSNDCPPRGGLGTNTTYITTYSLDNGLCTVKSDKQESIIDCPKPHPSPPKCNDEVIVEECIGNIRKVFNVTRHAIGGNICARNTAQSQQSSDYSCEKCCPTTDVYPGPCHGTNYTSYEREVTTRFWANEKDCCMPKSVVNKYACNPRKCPPDVVIKGSCMLTKQPIFLIWYVLEYDWTDKITNCVRKAHVQRIVSC